MQVKIIEAQDINSKRAGTRYEVEDLAAAKRIATRNQVFQGTVLRIEDQSGIMAVKEGGIWHRPSGDIERL